MFLILHVQCVPTKNPYLIDRNLIADFVLLRVFYSVDFTTPGHCFFASYVFACLLFSLFVCTVVLFATFWVNKNVYI